MPRSVPPSSACILAVLLACFAVGGCGEDGLGGFSGALLSITGFEAVNVVNGTDREVSGTVAVTDPNGSEILEDSFRLKPESEEDGWFQFNLSVEGDPAVATYEAAFSEPGSYRVSVRLDGGSSLEKTVEITAPSKQRLLVVLNRNQEPPIQVIRMPNPGEEMPIRG